MKLRDTVAQRPRGDPPEVVVEIHCRSEDLLIEDPEFTDGKLFWKNLSRNKQMTIEQHIRDELCRVGLECGDLAEPFARLVLADAVSREG